MENAADALKMAGAVLIFVLALSIIIPFFTQVKQTTDIILDYRDRETTYINGDYYYKASGTERQVGFETVIPTIMRVYLENYRITFKNLDEPLYTITKADGTKIEKYSLDLETNQNTPYENVTLGNDERKAEFLCGILYHKFQISESEFNKKFHITVGRKSLYEQLNGKKIIEYLGVYNKDNAEETPDIMKKEKRIITYIIE